MIAEQPDAVSAALIVYARELWRTTRREGADHPDQGRHVPRRTELQVVARGGARLGSSPPVVAACRRPYIDFVADTIGRPVDGADPYQTPAPASSRKSSLRASGGSAFAAGPRPSTAAAPSESHVAQVGPVRLRDGGARGRDHPRPGLPAGAGRVRGSSSRWPALLLAAAVLLSLFRGAFRRRY